MSSSKIEHERLVIIGAGPAAYTAAIYAARALLKPLVLAGFEAGGQLMTTTDVENYPGFAEAIQGPWLMEQMRAQADHVGARIESEHVVALELGQRPFIVRCDSGRTLAAEAIILATGAKAKWLGLDSEEAFKGFGVSACATCDGFFFRGKTVAVIGGGNTAVEEALHLSNLAGQVVVVHRRDLFRAEKILSERLASRHNVSIRWNTVVDSILGEAPPLGVNAIRLRNVVTGALDDLAVDGVFVAIGHEPATELVRGQSRSNRMATFRRRRGRPRPASRACSLPATLRTTYSVRRSRPPVSAAWRRSKPSAGSPPRSRGGKRPNRRMPATASVE